jgi:hypothetical protein
MIRRPRKAQKESEFIMSDLLRFTLAVDFQEAFPFLSIDSLCLLSKWKTYSLRICQVSDDATLSTNELIKKLLSISLVQEK